MCYLDYTVTVIRNRDTVRFNLLRAVGYRTALSVLLDRLQPASSSARYQYVEK